MENYFQNALQNFTFDAACGGAIRHLTDKGYTAGQIADALTFPAPYEKVRRVMTDYLLEKKVLLRNPPEREPKRTKAEYVREYDSYGKPSFRKVEAKKEGKDVQGAYIPCEYARMTDEKLLSLLNNREQEYLRGIIWEKKTMYHLLDNRMKEIQRKWQEAEKSHCCGSR